MKKGIIFGIVLTIAIVVLASFIPLFQSANQELTPTQADVPQIVEPVTASIIAEAKLWPKTDASLGFRTVGVLSEINVETGDTVNSGDVLAVLQGSGQYQLAYSEATLNLLQAEKDLKTLNDTAAKNLADAELAVIDAKQSLDEAEEAYAEFDTPEYRKSIDDANEAAKNKETDVKDAQDLVDDVADLATDSARRISVEDDFVKVRQESDELTRKYNLLVNDKDRASASITNAETALADAERERDEWMDGPKQTELDVLNQRITAAKDAQTSALQNLELMKIIAPFDGTVVSVNAVAGELISAGEPVLILVDPTEMILKTVDLSETNMSSVHTGDSVSVVFDAYPESVLKGTVTKITNWAGEYLGDVVFPVEITLDPTNLSLLWGMTASVTFD